MHSSWEYFVRQHRALVGVGAFPLLMIGCWLLVSIWTLTAPPRGYLAAKMDLVRGHYEVQSLGRHAPWKPQYTALLRERYGIENRTAGDCCVFTTSLSPYVSAYNAVMKPAVKRKFGHDVFAECDDEAKAVWTAAAHAD